MKVLSDKQVLQYDKYCSLQATIGWKIISSFIDCLYAQDDHQTIQSILDLGSGPGRITVRLADQLPDANIIGIDISETMVNYANTHNVRDNLTFLQQDMLQPFPMNKFDLIYSMWSLHWLGEAENQIQLLHNVLHACSKNGSFCLMLPLEHPYLIQSARDALLRLGYDQSDYPENRYFCMVETFEQLIVSTFPGQSASHPIYINASEALWNFKNKSQLIAFVKVVFTDFKPLVQQAYELFCEYLVEAYLAYLADIGAGFTGTFSFLLIHNQADFCQHTCFYNDNE